MNNNKRLLVTGIALVSAAVLSGCGSPEPVAKDSATSTAVAASYPVPEVQIQAQPVLASYHRKVSRAYSEYGDSVDETFSHFRRHKRHWRHKKAVQDGTAKVDADMGYMAADDPKLLEAEIAAKEKKQAAPDPGPEGR